MSKGLNVLRRKGKRKGKREIERERERERERYKSEVKAGKSVSNAEWWGRKRP